MIEIVEDVILVHGLNPMSEAPKWGYYNVNRVDTVLALIRRDIDSDKEDCFWCEVFFNKEKGSFSPIDDDLISYEDWALVGFIETPIFDLSLIENK